MSGEQHRVWDLCQQTWYIADVRKLCARFEQICYKSHSWLDNGRHYYGLIDRAQRIGFLVE
jgi:hypothetical protein